jgi:hypothetical protein
MGAGAGWLWSIPTPDRIGCGYVYSDDFRTPEKAHAEIETALGHKIEPRNDLKFDSGRIDQAWIGNCIALGLSSSFLEPLEATSIHGTIVQVLALSRLLLRKGGPLPDIGKARDEYNRLAARQLNDFRTFISTHYTGTRDEPFWIYARTECLDETARDIVARCARESCRGKAVSRRCPETCLTSTISSIIRSWTGSAISSGASPNRISTRCRRSGPTRAR